MNDKERLEKIHKIANNVLCWDDDSDYGTALWQILEIVKPDLFIDDNEPELEIID